MTTTTTRRTDTAPQWISAEALTGRGFTPAGPEIDYGMRWGAEGTIRVSYAPHPDRDGGYLYAVDVAAGQYALLCADTTPEQVDTAWQLLRTDPLAADGYLTLGQLAHADRPLPVAQARDLWRHCLDRELAARRDYPAATPAARFAAAQAVVVGESARRAAETVLHAAVAAELDAGAEPVVVSYRILGTPGCTGRLPADDLATAVTETAQVAELASRHGVRAQATSVAQGRTTVAATRIPELAPHATYPAAASIGDRSLVAI